MPSAPSACALVTSAGAYASFQSTSMTRSIGSSYTSCAIVAPHAVAVRLADDAVGLGLWEGALDRDVEALEHPILVPLLALPVDGPGNVDFPSGRHGQRELLCRDVHLTTASALQRASERATPLMVTFRVLLAIASAPIVSSPLKVVRTQRAFVMKVPYHLYSLTGWVQL